jgi:hypothetical protein
MAGAGGDSQVAPRFLHGMTEFLDLASHGSPDTAALTPARPVRDPLALAARYRVSSRPISSFMISVVPP